MAAEDGGDPDLWAQALAARFPPGARKRRALDPAISDARFEPDFPMSEVDSGPCLALSQKSNTVMHTHIVKSIRFFSVMHTHS